MAGALAYRPLASPLHATRAVISALWLASIGVAVLVFEHPLALGVIMLLSVGIAVLSGLRSELLRTLRALALIALPIVLINVLVSRRGLTVFARIGDLGPFGRGDLTVEALVYGVVFALKVGAFIMLGVLATLAIDPDELISRVMGLSFRSALTASIAIRMVPLLAADAERFADAQRARSACQLERGGPAEQGGFPERRRWRRLRPLRAGLRRRDAGASVGSLRWRALLVGATVSSALDRSLDVAATLELRGFACARRVRRRRRPFSRHDISFSLSALAVLALTSIGSLDGLVSFHAYPLLHMPISLGTVAICSALAAAAVAPLLDRRGIGH